MGIVRIVVKMTRPQSESHRRRTHGKSGMPRIGLLHRIGGKKTDCIDRSHLQIVI
jgi:hypothetical protein